MTTGQPRAHPAIAEERVVSLVLGRLLAQPSPAPGAGATMGGRGGVGS